MRCPHSQTLYMTLTILLPHGSSWSLCCAQEDGTVPSQMTRARVQADHHFMSFQREWSLPHWLKDRLCSQNCLFFFLSLAAAKLDKFTGQCSKPNHHDFHFIFMTKILQSSVIVTISHNVHNTMTIMVCFMNTI